MKKLLLLLCLFCTCFFVQAQDDIDDISALMRYNEEIDFNVDMSLFEQLDTNMFVSDEPRAMMSAILVESTYDRTIQLINEKDFPFEIIEKEEKKINGNRVLSFKVVAEEGGVNFNGVLSFIEFDVNKVVMFVAVLEDGADETYREAIQKSVDSLLENYTE